MKGRNILIGIVLLTSILFTTIVYSAFSTQLNIEGEAIVRSDQDIRITDIRIQSQTNSAYETYNNKYNKDVTFMYVTLPSNSSITYEIDIINKSNISYLIDSITEQSNTNQNVTVDISLNINDIVNSNSIKTFTITLTNNTDTEQIETLVYKYGFKLNSFTVIFNQGNLLYGLEDSDETINDHMKYSINNEIISVTALTDDGFGYTSGKVYLTAGKKYIFNCDTDAPTWESNSNSNNNSAEAFLVRNGVLTYGWIHMNSNNNYEFIPAITGEYWLRLDVNENGKTYKFWNISINEVDKQTKQVSYGSAYGELPIPTREGYTFKGWNGKNILNYNELSGFANNVDNVVSSDGYISDESPNSDYRGWYVQSSWFKTLSSGSYSVTLYFKQICTKSDNSHITIYDKDNNYILGTSPISNVQKVTYNFELLNVKDIGILVKGYDGIYRIQLEKGNTATEWEPYYVTSDVKVTQLKNHTLTAIWEKNE